MKTVVIFGAGIAGLSAAHEFAQLGYKVLVYEANHNAGGFFRSSRTANNMPIEYSWHGIGPWYHNVFDVMKQIPFDEQGSVYDKGLSRPMNFGIALDNIKKNFDDSYIFDKPKAFRMSALNQLKSAWLILKTWAANKRTYNYYSTLNAAEQWDLLIGTRSAKTWKATFGPWIGSDWKNVSLHHVGQFFRKNLMSGPTYDHKADAQGPAWKHGSRDGWLLLSGPSNECWINKWVTHLEKNNVEFFWDQSLYSFDFDGSAITAAHLASGIKVVADLYVLAINPFFAADIIQRTPALRKDDQLKLFEPLTKDGPHTQVSFRIAFHELIKWPRERTAIIIADSEFNLTLFAQEQIWSTKVALGAGVKSLWTGTACIATVPGRVYGLPLTQCTKEQFITEVTTQIIDCQELNFLIQQANDGRSLKTFAIDAIEVWHEWHFSPKGITPQQPKWVNNTNNQPYLPTQETSIANLLIAGAHTKTTADLWSVEAAVESGRRAAQTINKNVKVITQYKPLLLRALSRIDDIFFTLNMPHLLDILLAGLFIIITTLIIKTLFL